MKYCVSTNANMHDFCTSSLNLIYNYVLKLLKGAKTLLYAVYKHVSDFTIFKVIFIIVIIKLPSSPWYNPIRLNAAAAVVIRVETSSVSEKL